MSRRRTILSRLAATTLVGLILAGVAYLLLADEPPPPDSIPLAESRMLLPVRVDGLWGVIDTDGEVVLPPTFEEIAMGYRDGDLPPAHYMVDPWWTQPFSSEVFIKISPRQFMTLPTHLIVTYRHGGPLRPARSWPFYRRVEAEQFELWDADGNRLPIMATPEWTIHRLKSLIGGPIPVADGTYLHLDDRLQRNRADVVAYQDLANGNRIARARGIGETRYQLLDPHGGILRQGGEAELAVLTDSIGIEYALNPYVEIETGKREIYFGLGLPPLTVVSLDDGHEMDAADLPIINRPDDGSAVDPQQLRVVGAEDSERRFLFCTQGHQEMAIMRDHDIDMVRRPDPETVWLATSDTYVAVTRPEAIVVYDMAGAEVARLSRRPEDKPAFVNGGRNLIAYANPPTESRLFGLDGTLLATGHFGLSAHGQIVVASDDRRFGVIDEDGRIVHPMTFTAYGRTESDWQRIRDEDVLTLRSADGRWQAVTPERELTGAVPGKICRCYFAADGQLVYMLYLGKPSVLPEGDVVPAHKPITTPVYQPSLQFWLDPDDEIVCVDITGRERARFAGTFMPRDYRQDLLVLDEVSYTAPTDPENWFTGDWAMLTRGLNDRWIAIRTRVMDLRTGEFMEPPLAGVTVIGDDILAVEYFDGSIGYMRPDHTWLWQPQK